MTESSIESIAYVCRAEVARLRHLIGELELSEPRSLEPLLRALSKTGDTLSAALTRVSAYADHLDSEADDNELRCEPITDGQILDLVRRFRVAVKFGFCDDCGGVPQNDGDRMLPEDAAGNGNEISGHLHAPGNRSTRINNKFRHSETFSDPEEGNQRK